MKQELFANGSYLCYDDYQIEKNPDLVSFLKSDILKEIAETFEKKIIVVLGWDGTMLTAIRSNYDKNLPFLGVNFWHKGFLLNAKEMIKAGTTFVERAYPLLEIQAQNNGVTKTDIAINEVDIRTRTGKMVALDVSLSDQQSITIKGDGIIISTPAGSTGYNSSLWWPIVPHTFPAFVITPKAPWEPKGQRSILVEDSKIIKVNSTGRIPNTEIYCDGEELLVTDNDQETHIVVKKNLNPITVLIASDYLPERDGKVFGELGFQTGK